MFVYLLLHSLAQTRQIVHICLVNPFILCSKWCSRKYHFLKQMYSVSEQQSLLIIDNCDYLYILYIYISVHGTQLALRRWPNVNPYVGPTSAHQRWANVDLSIVPTVARQRWHNVVPTLARQRWHNVMPMVVCQRCANIGPTEAALLAFCEGNPSVTDRSPVEQTVELSNQWFETPMWSTSM